MPTENEFFRVVDEQGNAKAGGFDTINKAFDWRKKYATHESNWIIERYQTGPVKISYGIFGGNEVVREMDGTIEVLVLIQESGLFAGAPPEELQIQEIIPPGTSDESVQALLQELNSRCDLPFYVRRAKIQVLPEKPVSKPVPRKYGIWLHHYKDDPHVWAYFGTEEAAKEYMVRKGGVFYRRRGQEYDPKWAEEVLAEKQSF